jgi:hypothetical protein
MRFGGMGLELPHSDPIVRRLRRIRRRAVLLGRWNLDPVRLRLCSTSGGAAGAASGFDGSNVGGRVAFAGGGTPMRNDNAFPEMVNGHAGDDRATEGVPCSASNLEHDRS